MSDSENEDNIECKILDDDEEEDINEFSLQNNINEIFIKNGLIYQENNPVIDEVIKLHIKLGIKDDELIKEIEECLNNRLIDFSVVEAIANFTSKTNSTEKIAVLKELYKYISDPEFEPDNLRLIPEILKQKNPKTMNISFRDFLLEMKKELVLANIKINDKNIRDVIVKCVERNWNLSSIKSFQIKLKYLIPLNEKKIKNKEKLEKVKIENEEKRYIMKSLIDTITAFPINCNNFLLNLNEIDFKNRETIARDFYLKCSTSCDASKKALNTNDLLIALENDNLNYFPKEKIEQFRNQILKAKSMKKPENFKNWIKEFKNYDFKSKEKNDNIAKTLGVISYALEETRKYPLREAQILAILIFIDNKESQDDNEEIELEEEPKNEIIIDNEERNKKNARKKDKSKGIIEQISTGEGKSAIIGCLSAYFGLRGHKVDIITSSMTLASRDSIEFKEFYQIFDLVVDYVKDYQAAPYKADIVYGTFLNFEGDYLNEISYNKKIRGDRPYDIIIIDEVDNAFIDCIQGSTQLTHSSKGYQFLLPLYISIYMMVDFLDHMYLENSLKKFNEIISKEEFKDLDQNSKNRIYEEITDNYDRKEVFSKYIEKLFEDMKNEVAEKNPEMKEELKSNNNKLGQVMDKIQEANSSEGLKKYLIIPKFLNDFVQFQRNNWANSAFCAKNLYNKETDYTISHKNHDGYENITPIDRKNTGELEFNTVYRNGLHQMLQIKENLRVKPETLTHTFLSHISYFVKFKKKNFFGLTGTIGDKEAQTIYKRDSFDSNLVFIPSYMAKRFIELPPIICENNFESHIDKICEEIFFHFSKGRKILVICKDINEGINIENKLKKNEFISENPTINNNIFLYVRNDIDDLEEKLKATKKRIIISTNLGGRGTDIKTSIEEEKNGGLHVIITKLSSNSRTQKQAFGRTSRQGNKGSGQYIITKKKELKTYEQLINERARKEKEMIDNINLDVLLLKDELFEEYVHCLRKYPELNQRKGNNTKDEIDERWSFFLKKNFNNKVEHEEIRKNFQRFKTEINKIMRLPRYERFNNDFLRITDAFNTDENEEVSYEELYKYLIFENCEKCFYFSASYLKALVEFFRYEDNFENNFQDNSHCLKIIEYLKLAKKQVKILNQVNIQPTLKSVEMYKKMTGNNYFEEMNNYYDTAFYKQFKNREKILNNLTQHFENNIKVTEEYIRDYLPKNTFLALTYLCKENVKMQECLGLDNSEAKELDYLRDAGLDFTYVLKIKKPVRTKNNKYYFITLGFFISFIIGIFSVSLGLKFSLYLSSKLEENSRIEMVDIHEEQSLFSKIKRMILSMFQNGNGDENHNENNNANRNLQNENINENDNENNDKKDEDKTPDNISKMSFIEMSQKTLKNMKQKIIEIFKENINSIKEELKFLVFVDCLFKERNWKNLISNIVLNSFDTRDMLLKKGEIIRMFNKESEYKNAIEMLSQEVDKAIKIITSKIKNEFYKEGYELNKVKRFEHIIRRKRLEDLDDKSSTNIVNQILSQNILDKNGIFNKELFKIKENKKIKKNKNKNEQKKRKTQYVKIFYDCPYPKEIKSIKNIDDFSLNENFKLDIKHDLILQDVQMLYYQRNYKDADKNLFIDFTLGIKDIIKEVYDLSMINMKDEFKSFITSICQTIYENVKTYLENEIFPNILMNKTKIKKKKLTTEEQKVVNLINQNSEEKVFDITKWKKFKEILDN